MSGETPSMTFLKLAQDNFKSWCFNMNMLLNNQGLNECTSNKEKTLEIIDSDGKPMNEETDILKSQKALAPICLSLKEKMKAKDPFEAWKFLKAAF